MRVIRVMIEEESVLHTYIIEDGILIALTMYLRVYVFRFLPHSFC